MNARRMASDKVRKVGVVSARLKPNAKLDCYVIARASNKCCKPRSVSCSRSSQLVTRSVIQPATYAQRPSRCRILYCNSLQYKHAILPKSPEYPQATHDPTPLSSQHCPQRPPRQLSASNVLALIMLHMGGSHSPPAPAKRISAARRVARRSPLERVRHASSAAFVFGAAREEGDRSRIPVMRIVCAVWKETSAARAAVTAYSTPAIADA